MSIRRARSHAAILLLLCSSALFVGCDAPPVRPNLVVVLIDTLRADHVGYAGYTRKTTPRIDALAEESVTFMHHMSPASRTGPSVASLFTGLHPLSHGVMNPLSHFDAKGTLAPDHSTLAEILDDAGFETAAFGANANVSARFGFDQGFDRFDSLNWKPANVINRVVFSWLDERKGTAPFFLYVHYVDPHSPYDAPVDHRSRFADPNYQGRIRGSHRQLDRIVGGQLAPTEADITQLVALYDAEIRFLDEELGNLLDRLDASGVLDNSIIVVLSDHGEEFLEHGSVLHGYTLYQEQLRIPLLIRQPGLEPRRIESLTRQIDLLPTLLDLLDIDLPESLQGTSLASRMRGTETEKAPSPVLAEASLRAVKTVEATSFQIGDWKLIETRIPAPRRELYDLSNDPGEKTDVARSNPKRLESMTEEMKRFRDALPVGKAEAVELSDDEKRELRALGYMP